MRAAVVANDELGMLTNYVVLPYRQLDHPHVPIVRSYRDEQRWQRERAMVRATVHATIIMSEQHVPETIVDRVAEYIDDEWFEEDGIYRINLSMSHVNQATDLAGIAPCLDVLLREMDQYRHSVAVQRTVLLHTLRCVDWVIFRISDPNPAGPLSGRTNQQLGILAKLHEIQQRALLCDDLLKDAVIHDYANLLSSHAMLTVRLHDEESDADLQNFANLLLRHETRFPDLVDFVLCQVIYSHGAYDLIAHSRLFRDGPRVSPRHGRVQKLMSDFVAGFRRRESSANDVVRAFWFPVMRAQLMPTSEFADFFVVSDPQTRKVVGVQAPMFMTLWTYWSDD